MKAMLRKITLLAEIIRKKNSGVQMFRSLIRALATLALLAAASSATAASYDFSFSNKEGQAAGDVKGFVVLPDGDGTFALIELGFYQVPAALGYSSMEDVISDSDGARFNSFKVSGGRINAAESTFLTSFKRGARYFALNHLQHSYSYGSYLNYRDSTTSSSNGVLDANNFTLVYSATAVPPAAAVPLPAAAPLLLIGLGGLAALGRKRRAA
jgi:hypothetical protein